MEVTNLDVKVSKNYGSLERDGGSSLEPSLVQGEIQPLGSDPKNLVTHTFGSEVKYISETSFPIILAFLLQNLMPLNSISSLGHIGSVEVGAAALANMFAAISGWSIGVGMSTALDTLCAQAFTGSNDKRVLAVHLQRGILINLVLYVPVAIVWWNVEWIMLGLNQPENLALLCGQYLKVMMLGAPAFLVLECLKKFLQAQRIMKAQTYIMLTSVPINLILNYFLVRNPATTLGFIGAPITVVITQWVSLALAILYICFYDGYQCWKPWSYQALKNWYPYLQLGIPGIFMVCSEWWAFEIISLSASYLGTESLAAQSIVMSITNATYAVPFGLSVAVSNRVGNLLGEGDAATCKKSTQASLSLAFLFPCCTATFLYLFGRPLGALFTQDPKVLTLVLQLIPIAAFYSVLDCLATVSTGILRGQGRQKLGAIVYFVAFYILAIPLGLYLAFHLYFGVVGLYLGTLIALVLVCPPLIVLNLSTDWNRQVQLCFERLAST